MKGTIPVHCLMFKLQHYGERTEMVTLLIAEIVIVSPLVLFALAFE